MELKKQQRLGREIYNSRSRTGRNRSVVDDIAVLTAGGAAWTAGKPPENLPPLRDTALALVRDGSFVLVNGGTPEWYWLENVTVPLKGLIYEFVPNDSGSVALQLPGDDVSRPYTKEMRIFTQAGGAGAWSAWLAEGKPLAQLTQREQRALSLSPQDFTDKLHLRPDSGVEGLDAGNVYAHPGGLGLLYHAQWIVDRLEDIAGDIATSLNKINRLPVISGETGPRNEAKTAINNAENAIVFPGPVTIDRMVSDAVIRALQADADTRMDDYYDSLNVIPKEGANRPVARDRELRMQVMLQYVDNLHTDLARIYSDWSAPLNFHRLVVESPDDLLKRKQLLDSCLQQLGQDEYNRRVQALFGIEKP